MASSDLRAALQQIATVIERNMSAEAAANEAMDIARALLAAVPDHPQQVCAGCGAMVAAEDVREGGHIIHGAPPDLCGPVFPPSEAVAYFRERAREDADFIAHLQANRAAVPDEEAAPTCPSLWQQASGFYAQQCELPRGHGGPGHRHGNGWWGDTSPACIVDSQGNETERRKPQPSSVADGVDGRLRALVQDVLGKMRPVSGAPAYRQIHSRHLRALTEAATRVEPNGTDTNRP